MLGVSLPCNNLIIHYFGLDDVDLLFLWTNALEGVRDRSGSRDWAKLTSGAEIGVWLYRASGFND
jgi:hypothetical protein